MTCSKVSVVTVTKDDPEGLKRTLKSLQSLHKKPLEVIVVDGGEASEVAGLLPVFESELPIKHIHQTPQGIYAAMNLGRSMVSGDYIHYLNGGDEVINFDYSAATSCRRMKVLICDEFGNGLWWDRLRIGGFGYCHQGIIFPADHEDYSEHLEVSADFKLLQKTFPKSLANLQVAKDGFVKYRLGGFSTSASKKRDLEIGRALFEDKKYLVFLQFFFAVAFKKIIGRKPRRWLNKAFFGESRVP